MNKKMRELLALINAKHIEAKGFTEGETKDLEKASSLLDEADSLQKEYDIEKRLFEATKEDVPDDAAKLSREEKTVKAFADAARNGFPRSKDLNETTGEDGGYTVPEDIVTMVQKYRSAKFSLLSLVQVVPVKTLSGARTFKKRSQQTGFVKVSEGGKIPKGASPKYERREYKVDKYAGFFPVTNELLNDSDANITAEITEWIGDESRVTANKLIIAKLNEKEASGGVAELIEIESLDDVKMAFNVTLGQAFKPTSAFITNDNGLQWLDTLKDSDGNYILQPSPADPMQLVLCAGASRIPVHAIPNDDLPNITEGIPVYMGDLKEAIKYFDRQTLNLKASDVASAGDVNAFDEDLTLFRAIEREDVQCFDEQAYVRAVIPVAAG